MPYISNATTDNIYIGVLNTNCNNISGTLLIPKTVFSKISDQFNVLEEVLDVTTDSAEKGNLKNAVENLLFNFLASVISSSTNLNLNQEVKITGIEIKTDNNKTEYTVKFTYNSSKNENSPELSSECRITHQELKKYLSNILSDQNFIYGIRLENTPDLSNNIQTKNNELKKLENHKKRNQLYLSDASNYNRIINNDISNLKKIWEEINSGSKEKISLTTLEDEINTISLPQLENEDKEQTKQSIKSKKQTETKKPKRPTSDLDLKDGLIGIEEQTQPFIRKLQNTWIGKLLNFFNIINIKKRELEVEKNQKIFIDNKINSFLTQHQDNKTNKTNISDLISKINAIKEKKDLKTSGKQKKKTNSKNLKQIYLKDEYINKKIDVLKNRESQLKNDENKAKIQGVINHLEKIKNKISSFVGSTAGKIRKLELSIRTLKTKDEKEKLHAQQTHSNFYNNPNLNINSSSFSINSNSPENTAQNNKMTSIQKIHEEKTQSSKKTTTSDDTTQRNVKKENEARAKK